MSEEKKKEKSKFSDKTHPFSAILSVIGAVISFIILVVLCIKASKIEEGGGLIYGAVGIIVMLISLLNLLIAIFSFKKKEIYYFFPTLGTVLNGILSFIFLVIYIVGL